MVRTDCVHLPIFFLRIPQRAPRFLLFVLSQVEVHEVREREGASGIPWSGILRFGSFGLLIPGVDLGYIFTCHQ